MNKKAHIALVVFLLTVLVIVLFLNVQQNNLHNDRSVALFLNKTATGDKGNFAWGSGDSKPYQNIKPRKFSSTSSYNIAPDLNVDLTNPDRINARNSARQPVNALGNTGSTSRGSMGLSYNKNTYSTSSNGGFSAGAGASGYGGKRSGNSSGGSGGGGGSLNSRLIADRSTLAGQSALFAPLVPGAGSTTILVDPSTDPTEAERIPVGDGLGLLLLFGLMYAFWKFYIRVGNVN